MAGLTVPAAFEQHLTLGDGNPGQPLQNALGFDLAEVPNLYSTSGGEFRFKFQEHGVAYNETQASDYLVDVGLKVCSGTLGFSLRFSPTPVEKWGINFAGTVCVKHNSGEERVVYLPGTRTYDPAGITGEIRYTRVNVLYMRHNCIQSTEKKQQLLMFDFSAQIYQYVPCILFSDEKYIGVQSHTPYCGCYETWYIL